jgi:hypothetical protein
LAIRLNAGGLFSFLLKVVDACPSNLGKDSHLSLRLLVLYLEKEKYFATSL